MPPVRIAVLGSCMMDLVASVPRHPEGGGKGLNQAVAARRRANVKFATRPVCE